MPKNRVSKYVATHCSADVAWIEDKPTHCSSHKRRKGAHRIISGLVRALAKRETQQEVEQHISEGG